MANTFLELVHIAVPGRKWALPGELHYVGPVRRRILVKNDAGTTLYDTGAHTDFWAAQADAEDWAQQEFAPNCPEAESR